MRSTFIAVLPPAVLLVRHAIPTARQSVADLFVDGLIKKIGQVSPSRASSPYDLAIYHRMDLVYRSRITQVCTIRKLSHCPLGIGSSNTLWRDDIDTKIFS